MSPDESTSDLSRITRPRAGEIAGQYHFDVLDGWQQGRGAFGGLVIAMLARAIETHAALPDRPLRALDAQLPGATLVGPVTVVVEPLRAGTGVATLAARMLQGGEVRAHAVAVLGRTRGDEPAVIDIEPPRPMPWRDVPAIALEDAGGPTFQRHFEIRNTGPLPFVGEPTGRAEGWVRAKRRGVELSDAVTLASHIDVWWPAMFSRSSGPRPMATIAFALHVVSSLDGLDPAAPFFHRSRELATTQGYSAELRELWGEDGRLLAINTQTLAVIR